MQAAATIAATATTMDAVQARPNINPLAARLRTTVVATAAHPRERMAACSRTGCTSTRCPCRRAPCTVSPPVLSRVAPLVVCSMVCRLLEDAAEDVGWGSSSS